MQDFRIYRILSSGVMTPDPAEEVHMNKKRFKPRTLLLIELLLTLGITAVIAFSDFRNVTAEMRHDTADTQRSYQALTLRYLSVYRGITIPVKEKLQENPSFDEMSTWLQAHEDEFREAVGRDIYDGLAITYQGGYAHSWNYGDYSAYDPSTRIWYQEAEKANGNITVVAPYVTYVGGSFPNSDQYMEISVVERYTDEVSFDLDLKIYDIDALLKNQSFGYAGTQALLYDRDGYILSSTDRSLYCHNIKSVDAAVTADLSAGASILQQNPDRLRFLTIDGRIMAAYARLDASGNTYCVIIPLSAILISNFFSSTWIIPLLIIAEIGFYLNYRNTVADMNNRDAMIAALARSAFQYQLTVDVRAMSCTPDLRNRGLMPRDMHYQDAYARLRQRILKEEEQKEFENIFAPDRLILSEGKGLIRHIFTMDLRQEDGAAERRIMELGLLVTRMRGRVYASILGNDVTDQEVEKRQVIESISDQYAVTAIVSMDTMHADVLKADPEFAEMLRSGHGLMEIQKSFAEKYLKEEFAPEYCRLMAPEQIRSSLKDAGGFSFTAERRDGHWKTFRILRSVGFEQNHLFVFSAEDADEQMQHQKELQTALKRANAATMAKNEFLSRMSHDIRTPMNGIIGMTYIAMEQENSPRTQECLENISTSSKFLLGLVNDILDMQKAESGAIQLHPEPYPLKEFSRYLDSVVRPLYAAKHQEFIDDVKPDMNVIPLVDVLRFNQIVFNLLSNAVKYTPDGGRIGLQVRTSLQPDGREQMILCVSDTGIGIPEDLQKMLFEPFVQGARSDTSENRGSGLGLAIVKKMVDLMGGTVSVESAPGRGSVFTVTLAFDCIAQQQDSWSPADSECNDSYPELACRHVLLCEDHPMNREIVETLLTEKRMIVHPAEDGRIGLDLFNASTLHFYDVILMDIRMPNMDGYAAAEAIRSLPREDAGTVPIIAMSADAYEEDIRRCLACGMNAHIAKPFEPDAMFRTISRMIRPAGKPENAPADGADPS